MKQISTVAGLMLAVILSGCATHVPQMLAVPKMEGERTHVLAHSPLLDQTDHMNGSLDERRVIRYNQQFGGAVALGVLLGPLGVAANIAAINSNTDSDIAALKGKLQLDPVALFDEAGKAAAGLELKPNGSTQLSPYFYVSKMEDESLALASALIVTVPQGDKNWVGTYFYQLPMKLGKAELAAGLSAEKQATLQQYAREGFGALAALYRDDAAGKLVDLADITFQSDFVTPRFKFDMLGKKVGQTEQRVVIRSVGVMYSLPADAVKVTTKTAS
jgi:hypothetical protein